MTPHATPAAPATVHGSAPLAAPPGREPRADGNVLGARDPLPAFSIRDGRWACALVVASLPWMMLAHSAVNKFLGFVPEPWRALAYPETIAAVALATPIFVAHGGRAGRERSWSAALWLAALTGAWFVVSALAQHAPSAYWVRRLGMEWVVGPLLGIAFRRHLDERGFRLTQEALAWSLLVASAYALALYWLSFGIPHDFRELVVSIRTSRAQLSPREGVYFGWFTFGGINDVAAYFAVALVLYLGMLAERGERHPVRFLAVPFALALEFLCYSRGVILFLIAAIAGLGLLRLRERTPTPPTFRLATALCAAFAVGVFVPPGALEYWRLQADGGGKSTAALRLRLWSRVADAEGVAAEFESNLPARSVERMRAEAMRLATAPSAPEPRVAAGATPTPQIAAITVPPEDAAEAGEREQAAPQDAAAAAEAARERLEQERSTIPAPLRDPSSVVAHLLEPSAAGDVVERLRWNEVPNAEAYYVYVGATPGGRDVADSGEIRDTAWPAAALPVGRDLHLRLNTKLAGMWRHQDATLRLTRRRGRTVVERIDVQPVDLSQFPPVPIVLTPDELRRIPTSEVVALLLEPRSGDGAARPLHWTQVPDAQVYTIWVGTTSGGKDVIDSGETASLWWSSAGLPVEKPLFFRLFTKLGDVWRHQDGSLRIAIAEDGTRRFAEVEAQPVDLRRFPPAPIARDPGADALRAELSERVGGLRRRLAFGYGTGNYGILAGATPDMGVHNIFLESFLSGGVLGCALFFAFWLTVLWRALQWARSPAPARAGGPTTLVALLLLSLIGAAVSVRLENLGTLVLGTIVWWLAAGPYAARGDARPADAESAA